MQAKPHCTVVACSHGAARYDKWERCLQLLNSKRIETMRIRRVADIASDDRRHDQVGACARDALVTSKKSRWGRFYARHRTRRRHSAWYDQRIHDLLTQRNRMQARNTRTMCLAAAGNSVHRTENGDACSNQHSSLSLRYLRVSGLGLHRVDQIACIHLSPRVFVWKRSPDRI